MGDKEIRAALDRPSPQRCNWNSSDSRPGASSVAGSVGSRRMITYDGMPSYTVRIMEIADGKVRRETQDFGDPFEASAWRAQWVERID
jgi:hypothetical protein